MSFGLKNKDIKRIKDVFHLHNKVNEVLIFGSRAMGTERLGSDIDLAVKGEHIDIADILKIRTQLDELRIAYECDVVDYNTIKTPEFKEHIDKHGIVFYQREEKPSEWKTYKLGDITEKIGSGATPRGGKEAYLENGDYSLIRSQNILDFAFSKNGLAYISEKQATELRNVTIKEDDILLNITGDSVARVCQVPKEVLPARVNQHVAIVRGKKEAIDQSFLKYYLLEPSFKRYMLGLASSGATRNALTKAMIENFEIQAPKLKTQKEIAQILSSLDDKIELLQQMNQTLENIAQAIFKEWFVDFNFPEFDGESLDGLPKGWRIEPIDENIEFLNGLALQKFPPLDEEEYLPVIKIRELRQGITNSSDKASTGIPQKYIINDGDILFSWSGSLDVVMWSNGKGALNQHLFKVSSEKYPKWFYYYWVKHFLPLYQSIASDKATTMGHIQRRHLKESIINVPNIELLEKANDVLEPIFDRLQNNSIQIRTLTQTRDTLLPKLMSGQLEVQQSN